MLIVAIIFVTAALIFYSVGTWINIIKKTVTKPVFITLWLGVVCDTTGTIFMILISPGLNLNFHSILGLTALGLMAVKGIINTVIFTRKNGEDHLATRLYGLVSWILWLFVYFSGVAR